MLACMGCLIGAAYTRKAEAAGLTGQADPSMGRVAARYADWRIGILARWSQLWIDRNFALDYLLKSLEKVVDGRPYGRVRDSRRVLKSHAYLFLGAMIEALEDTDTLADDWTDLEERCTAMAKAMIRELRNELEPAVAAVQVDLTSEHRDLLGREYDRWAATTEWRLINAADPCGT